jgi:CBS domain-containing protein
MLNSVDLQDYMIHNPVKISPDADIFDAVAIILDNKISGLCVVDEEGKLVGVLSELDCLQATLSAMYEGRSNVGTVKEYMSVDVDISGNQEDIVDVARDMLKNGHRRRPVIKDGKLVGQITCRQLLRALKDVSARK